MGVWKDLVKAIVRWALNIVFGSLVARGLLAQEQVDTWVLEVATGLIVLISTLAWALWDKHKSWLFGKLALANPSETPPELIKREIKAMPLNQQLALTLKESEDDDGDD